MQQFVFWCFTSHYIRLLKRAARHIENNTGDIPSGQKICHDKLKNNVKN